MHLGKSKNNNCYFCLFKFLKCWLWFLVPNYLHFLVYFHFLYLCVDSDYDDADLPFRLFLYSVCTTSSIMAAAYKKKKKLYFLAYMYLRQFTGVRLDKNHLRYYLFWILFAIIPLFLAITCVFYYNTTVWTIM